MLDQICCKPGLPGPAAQLRRVEGEASLSIGAITAKLRPLGRRRCRQRKSRAGITEESVPHTTPAPAPHWVTAFPWPDQLWFRSYSWLDEGKRPDCQMDPPCPDGGGAPVCVPPHAGRASPGAAKAGACAQAARGAGTLGRWSPACAHACQLAGEHGTGCLVLFCSLWLSSCLLPVTSRALLPVTNSPLMSPRVADAVTLLAERSNKVLGGVGPFWLCISLLQPAWPRRDAPMGGEANSPGPCLIKKGASHESWNKR